MVPRVAGASEGCHRVARDKAGAKGCSGQRRSARRLAGGIVWVQVLQAEGGAREW